MCDLLPAYERRLPIIRRVAREFGYAIGLHGSGRRDLDLIAVPWTVKAHADDELVEAIALAIQGVIIRNGEIYAAKAFEAPAHRPHGRLAWSIQIGGGRYIDLSVMPRHVDDINDEPFGTCPVCLRDYYRTYGCEYCYALTEARTLDVIEEGNLT